MFNGENGGRKSTWEIVSKCWKIGKNKKICDPEGKKLEEKI
jgi:hypothetical protein